MGLASYKASNDNEQIVELIRPVNDVDRRDLQEQSVSVEHPLILSIVCYLHGFDEVGLLILLEFHLKYYSEIILIFYVTCQPYLAPYL